MRATSGAPTKKPAANKLTINAMVDDIKTAASSKDDEEENQLRDKDKKKGMPRGIMLASVFHGDSRAMEASLAKGELQSHKDDAGMEYLSFRELQTMEEAHTLAGLMSKMKWEWVCKKADQTRLEQDAHLPEGFLKTLAKAATACDKLLKEGLKLSKERGLAEKEGALKAAYADLTKHQSQIEHVKTWKELPNTDGPLTKGALDNFLLDIARDVDKYNREIESVKGILKARRN
ncbi:unnamed protein product [Effrenium voratum]|uniref:Uncharacterized protein n=1 Tax=Effrenium voratum TaxID=2562239 RepID=A0AA36JRS5_9DINO|nr:unnamed protein product [Effrenium voratum]